MAPTIKQIRKAMQLTQEQFAFKFNIPVSTLQKWETRARKPPEYVIGMIEHIVSLELDLAAYENNLNQDNFKEVF